MRTHKIFQRLLMLCCLLAVFILNIQASTNHEIFGSEYAGWDLLEADGYTHPHVGDIRNYDLYISEYYNYEHPERNVTFAKYNGYLGLGLALWSNSVPQADRITYTYDFTPDYSDNRVEYFDGSFYNSPASTYFEEIDANNHVVRWVISIYPPYFDSLSYNAQYRTIAHEFGHTFGLKDLYVIYNSEHLMYGYVVCQQ